MYYAYVEFGKSGELNKKSSEEFSKKWGPGQSGRVLNAGLNNLQVGGGEKKQ